MKKILKIMALILFLNLNGATHIVTIPITDGITTGVSSTNSSSLIIPDPVVDAEEWRTFFNNYCYNSSSIPFSDVSDMYNKMANDIISCDLNLSITIPTSSHGIPFINNLTMSDDFIFKNLDSFADTTGINGLGIRYPNKNNIDGLGNISGGISNVLNLDYSEFTNINALSSIN